MMKNGIVVGAFVSVIPDDGCRDVQIDQKWYKECNGVLFEPVKNGDTTEYQVVNIEKSEQ